MKTKGPFIRMRRTRKKISAEHMAILDDLFPRAEVRNEIVRRCWNTTTFICSHGKKVFFKTGCSKCDRDIHNAAAWRQSVNLSDACMYRWMIRAAELGDKQARRYVRRYVESGHLVKPLKSNKSR